MAVITLSRQSGSDGNIVAERLCQKLGYRLFDKALMSQLAEKLNAEIEIAEPHPEKLLLERILNPFDSAIAGDYQTQKVLSIEDNQMPSISQIRELILAAYEHGNIVIVGRGSQVVLADKPDVLHVRVVAPREMRIRAWQKREGLSYKDASKKVSQRDRAHVDFVKNYFDTDLQDPALYDLIVNTQKLSPQSAADLIIQALHNIEPPG